MAKTIRHNVLYLITLLFLVHTLTPHQHQQQEQELQVCSAHTQLPQTFLKKWIHHFEQHHAEGQMEWANPNEFNLEKDPLHLTVAQRGLYQEGPFSRLAASCQLEPVYRSFWFNPDERGPPAWT